MGAGEAWAAAKAAARAAAGKAPASAAEGALAETRGGGFGALAATAVWASMAVGATAGDMPGATAMVAVARAVGARGEAAREAAD